MSMLLVPNLSEALDELEAFDFEGFRIFEMRTFPLARKYNLVPRPEKSTPEQNLWAAVVIQALDDLFLYPKAKKPSRLDLINCQRIRGSARAFLFSNSPPIAEHRKFVFLSAGLDIEIAPQKLRQQSDEFESKYG